MKIVFCINHHQVKWFTDWSKILTGSSIIHRDKDHQNVFLDHHVNFLACYSISKYVNTFNPFQLLFYFYPPLKTENIWFSDVFRRYRKTSGMKWVNRPSQHHLKYCTMAWRIKCTKNRPNIFFERGLLYESGGELIKYFLDPQQSSKGSYKIGFAHPSLRPAVYLGVYLKLYH